MRIGGKEIILLVRPKRSEGGSDFFKLCFILAKPSFREKYSNILCGLTCSTFRVKEIVIGIFSKIVNNKIDKVVVILPGIVILLPVEL